MGQAWTAFEFLCAPFSTTFRLLQESVGVAPPTKEMLQEEDHKTSALLRNLPVLKENIAYRALGDNFPTPVHEGAVVSDTGFKCHFYIKREDLSSPLYAGNKVRSLQFQLAVVESRLASGEPNVKPVTVTGTYGSNQTVATSVFVASKLPALLSSLNVGLAEPEVPDIDNTLNVLSIFSFSRNLPLIGWGRTLGPMLRAAYFGKGTAIQLGGNSPSGVMGQVSAMLELADHI